MTGSGDRTAAVVTPAAGERAPALSPQDLALSPRQVNRRWRAFRQNGIMLAGLAIVLLFLTVAVAAPLLAPHDPAQSFSGNRLRPPSERFPFGTDEFSRDVLSRVIFGTQISMVVGVSVAVLAGLIGGVLGLLTGFYGRFDMILMRILDGLMAFPGILLAIALSAVLRPSLGTVIAALTIVYTPYCVRVLRAQVLYHRESTYVIAARGIGARDWRILLLHLLPNCIAPLLVQITFTFSFGVLAEATLSFLGVGVPPPTPSWGSMLADAKVVLQRAPWLTLAPGLALTIITLGLNLLGDGLRDLLDPRHVTSDVQGMASRK